MGQPVAWKAGTHLAIVLKTNIEHLSEIGFNFVGGEFVIDHNLPVVRVQSKCSHFITSTIATSDSYYILFNNLTWLTTLVYTILWVPTKYIKLMKFNYFLVTAVSLTGEPNKATDIAMRSLRNDTQVSLRLPKEEFHWPVHAALLRKLSKVVDIKSEVRSTTAHMNGSTDTVIEVPRKTITLADVSCNTTKSLNADDEDKTLDKPIALVQQIVEMPSSQEKIELQFAPTQNDDKECVLENVTVEIQHNITPKKSSLKLDLKKGTSQLSASLLNISSQIKSVTTHKRVVSTTGPKRPSSQVDSYPVVKEESSKSSSSQQGTPKSVKCSRPLANTKSPNVLIYSDSVAARDNLEASLRKVLDCDR